MKEVVKNNIYVNSNTAVRFNNKGQHNRNEAIQRNLCASNTSDEEIPQDIYESIDVTQPSLGCSAGNAADENIMAEEKSEKKIKKSSNFTVITLVWLVAAGLLLLMFCAALAIAVQNKRSFEEFGESQEKKWQLLYNESTRMQQEFTDMINQNRKFQENKWQLLYNESTRMQQQIDKNKESQEKKWQLLSNDIHSMQQQISDLIARPNSMTQQQSPHRYSFSVYVSSGSVTLSTDDIVPFDTKISDPGSDFSTSSHKYTCPKMGMYYFILCINQGELGASYNTNSEVALMIGSSMIFRIYSYNADGSTHYIREQGCNAVVRNCQRGSDVYAKATIKSELQGYSDSPRTVFTGILLYED